MHHPQLGDLRAANSSWQLCGKIGAREFHSLQTLDEIIHDVTIIVNLTFSNNDCYKNAPYHACKGHASHNDRISLQSKITQWRSIMLCLHCLTVFTVNKHRGLWCQNPLQVAILWIQTDADSRITSYQISKLNHKIQKRN